MTFLEALATGRPIRRKLMANVSGPWMYLGESTGTVFSRPQWRRIDTGEPIGLYRHDYLASDWESMP